MLSTLGATVVVAADGSEAVAMFINALEIASSGAASEERVALPYDVIFMDCQVHRHVSMPSKSIQSFVFGDGFDTAKSSLFPDAGDGWLRSDKAHP
jgi:CheY-like chemotaxis protein